MACDEITGLVTAVALVRPSRSLLDLEPSSVKKKWKDKAFAAGTDRAEMEQAAQRVRRRALGACRQRHHRHAHHRPRAWLARHGARVLKRIHADVKEHQVL